MEETQEYTHEELMDYESTKADMEHDRMKEEKLFAKSDNTGELL